MGSAAYAAPEQIRGEQVDGRADVYALGCVLFECLTGRRPFEAEDELALMWAHMHEPPPRPSELDPALVRLRRVVARALAKEPDERASLDDLPSADLAERARSGERHRHAVSGGRAAARALLRRSSAVTVSSPRWSRCLEQGARLVTLTGPGGSGKTRLALEAAARLVPKYRDGVHWVGLCGVARSDAGDGVHLADTRREGRPGRAHRRARAAAPARQHRAGDRRSARAVSAAARVSERHAARHLA